MARLRVINKRGQVLVELLVGMAMAALVMPVVVVAFFAVRGGGTEQDVRVQAQARVREGREVIRLVKEADWERVAVNGVYHPQESGGEWSLAPGEETLGLFARRIEIEDGYRDSEGEIVESGTLDPSTKKVTVSVTWSAGGVDRVESSEYYLMRLENLSLVETTEADFEDGNNTGTTVTAEDDGEVTLGAGGGGNWCEPNLSLSAYDLPKSGAANAVSAMAGRVFAGTGDNSSGVSFANLSVTTDSPPSVTLLGTFDGYKTNDIYGEADYAYLGTDNNQKEVVIVNLTTSPYTEAGSYNAPGNGSGESVYVDGSVGYVTVGSVLYSFDLSQKSGSRGTLGSVNLGASGKSVLVQNGYAYVATDSSSVDMWIVNVSNPASMQVVGSVNVSGERGVDVDVNQTATRAFLVTKGHASADEMFVVDISNKGVPSAVGSFDTGGMDPTGVRVVTFNRVVVAGIGGLEYQVVDVSNENSPTACGEGLNIDSGIRDIDTVLSENSAYSYLVTGDATEELKIVEGGPGGQFSTEGVYESGSFDAGHSTMFNRFEVVSNVPAQTAIQYQVAVTEAVNDNCEEANYAFVGPDMTGDSFFPDSAQFPLGALGGYGNPGRCMRYKAYLSTTEGTVAPSLLSIVFNYSP